jgi:hypothetical protein
MQQQLQQQLVQQGMTASQLAAHLQGMQQRNSTMMSQA